MGKAVSSGLHQLSSVFGKHAFELSRELRSLRSWLQTTVREHDAVKAKQLRDRKLAVNLFAIGIFILFAVALYLWSSYWTNDRETTDNSANVILLLFGGCICVVLVTCATWIQNRFERRRRDLGQESQDLRSQIERQVQRYAALITEELGRQTSKRGEIGSAMRRGISAWLFYCPSYAAMLDFDTEDMLLINAVDCRDVQISYRDVESRSVSAGTVQSAVGRSLTGAAVGGLIFGDAGMIVGSVIGSAGERKLSLETVERKLGKYMVDLYTRLQNLPVVTLDFNDDEVSAKQFYAIMSASVLGQKQT